MPNGQPIQVERVRARLMQAMLEDPREVTFRHLFRFFSVLALGVVAAWLWT